MISAEYTITDLNQLIYNFAFDYLKKKYVKVSSKNITTGVVTNYTYGAHYVVVDKTIELLQSVGAVGDVLRIVRETSTSEQIVSWNDASILKASDMSLSQIQQLHILEEYGEYMSTSYLALDVNGQYDAKNSRVVNLATPQDSTDAVNRGYIDSFIGTLENAEAVLGGATTAISEATGYGIISGGTVQISGMTATVSELVAHMPDGKRHEKSKTTLTITTADTTNPRVDLVYLSSAGVITYTAGNPASTPVTPTLPGGALALATISVLTNATTGTVTDIRSLKQIQEAWSDTKVRVFGTEYLSSFHKKLMADTTTTIVMSGDSTTAGDKIIDYNYILPTLLYNMTQQLGMNDIGVVNHGHSGKTTKEWASTYVNDDLSASPDCLILRWGINDYPTSDGDIYSFETSLIDGLFTIRSQKNVTELSIILMTPNSTWAPTSLDIASLEWHEKINNVIRKLARRFNCCFIDTFSIWYDSYADGIDWIANDVVNGKTCHVHPLEVMNTWICSKICDVLFPSFYRGSMVLNDTLSHALQASTLPPLYPLGVSLYLATPGSGFPFAGTVTTIKQKFGTVIQYLSNYAPASDGTGGGTNASFTIYRTGYKDTWLDWNYPVINDSLANNNNDLPTNYAQGITQRFVLASNGFPISGQLVTFQQQFKKVSFQLLFGYDDTSVGFYFRTGWDNPSGAVWTKWEQMYTSFKGKLTVPPIVGTYEVGDTIVNSAPTAGGYIGWVCITGGTPGVWKGYGLIQA